MKYLNEKIAKWVKWTQEGDDGNFRYIILSPDCFELYRLENPEVEALTDKEKEYINKLYKVQLQNDAAQNKIKGDIGKLFLGNDFAITDKPKENQVGPVDYVLFDTSDLATEPTTSHETDSLENEAVKNL